MPFYKKLILIVGWLIFAVLTFGFFQPSLSSSAFGQPWWRMFIIAFCIVMVGLTLLFYLETRFLRLKPSIAKGFIRDTMLIVSLPCIILYIGWSLFLFLPIYNKIDAEITAEPIFTEKGERLSLDHFLSVYQQTNSLSFPLEERRLEFYTAEIKEFMGNNGLDVSPKNVNAFTNVLANMDDRLAHQQLLLTLIIFFWVWGVSLYLAAYRSWYRHDDGNYYYE